MQKRKTIQVSCGVCRKVWDMRADSYKIVKQPIICISCQMTIRNTKHGEASSKKGKETNTYRTYQKMKDRCYNKNHMYYKYYGEKGITISDRWLENYKNFVEDMGHRPFDGATIDRLDSSKGYYKENCEWVSRSENLRRMHKARRDTPVSELLD